MRISGRFGDKKSSEWLKEAIRISVIGIDTGYHGAQLLPASPVQRITQAHNIDEMISKQPYTIF